MIKNLLEPDEYQPNEIKPETKNKERESPSSEINDEENLFDMSELIFDAPTNSETVNRTANVQPPAAIKIKNSQPDDNQTLFQPLVERESTAETVRRSGLAYAAAITLFGAVVFMLVLGWFADLLLGTSPWGVVGGIVLGAIIGFFQFFRMTSQIFKDKE